MSVATSRSISAGDIDVVPPLMWPTTCGPRLQHDLGVDRTEPAIDGPPVWMVTVMPCCLAQRTMGAAS